jgi:predicted metal-dependent enzyme (double-stranded beta helix superfamily)
LRYLAEHADAACRAAMDEIPGRMAAGFAAVIGDADLLPAAARVPDPLRYTRHLLHADPQGRFTIVALVWGPGQFSPVHGHHAWCAYGIHAGPLTETSYRHDAARGIAVPQASTLRHEGETSFAYAGLDAIHKLGNAGDNVGMSIHIYGLDSGRVGTHVNRLVPVAPWPDRLA